MGVEKKHFCCEEMRFFVDQNEIGLIYLAKYREFGFEYRDGGNSLQLIRFCPWCGSNLPSSLRDEWFDRLNDLGIDDCVDSRIPELYQTSGWWENDPDLYTK
ncbi:DUF6980 family protein [Stenoxybacter acetivorans]|uniref:DUF6980 family protein n=1 Tax=Stenoxybacter acetivorans TaxID=422441 RepID=UPI00068B5CCA|nr:hypothetical protein [Stenoxybacter acetivorans]